MYRVNRLTTAYARQSFGGALTESLNSEVSSWQNCASTINGTDTPGCWSLAPDGKLFYESGWKQATPAACTFKSDSITFKFSDYFKKFAICLITYAAGIWLGAGFFRIISNFQKFEGLWPKSPQFFANASSVIYSTGVTIFIKPNGNLITASSFNLLI